MPLARITEIKPNGGFDSQHGYMYSSIVYFDDNGWGSANHKTQNPPYGIGDEMEYTITGEFKGTSKLKISKPGSNFAPPPRDNGPSSSQSRTLPPKTVQSGPVNGASVGMAINQAMGLLTKDLSRDEIVQLICQPHFWLSLTEVASDVIRIARHLEQGNLAPSVKERANGVSTAKVSVTPMRTGNVATVRQTPQPERFHQVQAEDARAREELDEDVPF